MLGFLNEDLEREDLAEELVENTDLAEKLVENTDLTEKVLTSLRHDLDEMLLKRRPMDTFQFEIKNGRLKPSGVTVLVDGHLVRLALTGELNVTLIANDVEKRSFDTSNGGIALVNPPLPVKAGDVLNFAVNKPSKNGAIRGLIVLTI